MADRSNKPPGKGKSRSKKKSKEPDVDPEMLARLQRETESYLQEANEYLVRVREENKILDAVTVELGTRLTIDVEEKTTIIRDLESELMKAEAEIEEWTERHKNAQAARDEARSNFERDTTYSITVHRDTMVKLEAELEETQKRYKQLDPMRKEKEAIYAALKQADAELRMSRRLHHSVMASHDQHYKAESDKLKRAMRAKVEESEQLVSNIAARQTRLTEARTKQEFYQVQSELQYQGKQALKALMENDKLRVQLRDLRHEVDLEEDRRAMLRESELSLQRAIVNVSEKLAFMQQCAIKGDLDAFVNNKSLREFARDENGNTPRTHRGGSGGSSNSSSGGGGLRGTPRIVTEDGQVIAHVSTERSRPWAINAKRSETIATLRRSSIGNLIKGLDGEGGTGLAVARIKKLSLVDAVATHRQSEQQLLAKAGGIEGRESAVRTTMRAVGKLKELEKKIESCARELVEITRKTAIARAQAGKTEKEMMRVLELQDDALELIESTLHHMDQTGRPALGARGGKIDLTPSTQALLLSSSTSPTGGESGNDPSGDKGENQGGLIRWAAVKGIPPKVSHIIREDVEALLALLHQKLSIAPIIPRQQIRSDGKEGNESKHSRMTTEDADGKAREMEHLPSVSTTSANNPPDKTTGPPSKLSWNDISFAVG